MVKINIIVVGKDKEKWVTNGCDHFIKLLSRFARVEFTVVSSPKGISSLSPNEIKKKEAELLKKRLAGAAYYALSDNGKKMDSPAFSRWLDKTSAGSGGKLVFVVSGPYGLDESLISGADQVISLSSLTFSHQLVRLVLLEQLYRAFSIIHGTDYHK